MKKIYCTGIVLAMLGHFSALAQFGQFYPISDNPNINWKSSLVSKETILFEANPNVRFSFFNNMIEKFAQNGPFGQAYYASFKPQLRMYTDNSLPVKMPSYRIQLGVQHMYRVKEKNLFAYSLESGHYSNGQDGCTYNENFPDGSAQCDSVYRTITSKSNLSDLLNRRSGEFSTNLTELMLSYRINQLKDGIPVRIHAFKLGVLLYHDRFLGIFNFGGYADHDINIYGHWRFSGMYERTWVLENGCRVTASQYAELIQGAHEWVNPLRTESTCSFFFKNDVGVFASYIYGHDNYNIRFVDSGSQVSLGIAWNAFPAIKIR